MRMKAKKSRRTKRPMRVRLGLGSAKESMRSAKGSLRSAKGSLRSAKVSLRSAMTRMHKRWSRLAKTGHLVGAVTGGAAFLIVLCAGAAALIAMREPTAVDEPRIERPAGADEVPATRSSRPVPSAHPTASPATPALRYASDTTTADATLGEGSDDDSAVAASAQKAAPVTIAGCLERDGQAFRLTDTRGTDTPKERSWRSGFLRKHPASITVVDSGNTLKLPSHVGQRVSVSGSLDDRQMHARSLHRVGESCS